ncbi:MAG: DNA-protecting protein DprA [Gammaproteobacteria bacterium]|nr:DNA-protecting protein DprA [Gammaproteobacteria bacterium]MBV9695967.1 DNA-protecting protein DprA [Gammaproteobacteria bacterium]
MDAPFARALLARTPQLDARALHALLAAGGGDVRAALTPAARRGLELPEAAARWLAAPDRGAVEADLAWLAQSSTQLLLAHDPQYPPALTALTDAPAALYVQGELATLTAAQLALTGTRHPSPQGVRSARDFAASFARAGLVLTSSLSEGIEAEATQAALTAGGRVLGVSGVALDVLPRVPGGTLPARIVATGALLSELPPRTVPARAHFAARLRLVSALARGTLVIEAARRGAPMTLARHALEQGRAVLAVPGSIHDPRSRGPHQLLREGATLVEGVGDVWAELGNSFPAPALSAAPAAVAAAPALDNEYEMLLDAVGFEPATVGILAARTQLPSESVASMLLILELQGRVAALPGGRYGRTP